MTETTNGDVINKALKEGPLPKDELVRRAKIVLYNDLSDAYGRKIASLLTSPNLHPETRQVMAQTADFINDLVCEILVELSAEYRAKKENK